MSGMRIKRLGGRLLRAQSGTAAIEFVFVMPLLLTLSFGMLNFWSALSTQRNLSYAATVMAQLITQKAPEITAAQIDDFFNAAELALRRGPDSNVARVEVYAFRLNGNTPQQIWARSNNVGNRCATPDTTGLAGLMNGPNDVVVAVVCATHQTHRGWARNVITNIPALNLQAQMIFRPRTGNTINCPTCT